MIEVVVNEKNNDFYVVGTTGKTVESKHTYIVHKADHLLPFLTEEMISS